VCNGLTTIVRGNWAVFHVNCLSNSSSSNSDFVCPYDMLLHVSPGSAETEKAATAFL
jgi:hypothetical protein